MSNGADADDSDDEDGGVEGTETSPVVAAATFEGRLDDIADSLKEADTEADLDDVEGELDEIVADFEDATLEITDADESEDGDDADGSKDGGQGDSDAVTPGVDERREELAARIGDLRDDLESQRGPYAQDVTDTIDEGIQTLQTSELTVEGVTAAATACRTLCETIRETLDSRVAVEVDGVDDRDGVDGTIEDLVTDLETAIADIEATELDADDDADTITTLLDAAETFADSVENAQVFGDLEIREQLDRQGFYDVLTPRNRTDFPPEWNAIKLYESRGEVEPILQALDRFDSDFMEENALNALEHMAPEEAFEAVHALAQRRNEQPVRILGRIGDERACDTLVDFLGGGDTALEKTSLRALGAIGSEETTEAVAQRLVASDPAVRSVAARSLGLIGDTRAIDPLATRLGEDDAATVRASAAWALAQIGTAQALEALREYGDDDSPLVRVEAERVAGV